MKGTGRTVFQGDKVEEFQVEILGVLENAGPWLPVPPPDDGGIETVVATLVPELRARGHRVVLATVGERTIEADEVLSVVPRGQFADSTGPLPGVLV